VLFQLGVVNLAENKYKEAEDAFRRSYELNPANSRGLMGMVETQMAQNHPDQPCNCCKPKPPRSQSDDFLLPSQYRGPAGRLTRPFLFEKVAAAMQKGSKSQGDIYLRIGETYRRKGDLTNSIIALQKARAILRRTAWC